MPREPDKPTPADVLEEMAVGEPYTVRELVNSFDNVSRWTIQRRLETLLEDDKVQKKKHSEKRVTWWRDE